MLAPKFWFKTGFVSFLLLPLAWLFWLAITLRRYYYKIVNACFQGALKSAKVLVVGNLNVGGSGKTPLVISLAKFFGENGYKVAVISRGYGANTQRFPHQVNPKVDSAKMVGDEPLLIAKSLDNAQGVGAAIAVWIDPKRERIAKQLSLAGYQIILSDDGLQHYALRRQGEMIATALKALGNKRLLPAGPLREPLSRLKQANWVVVTSTDKSSAKAGLKLPATKTFSANLTPCGLTNLLDPSKALAPGSLINAACAIGYPPKFFNALTKLGFHISRRFSYPDHHQFTNLDIASWGNGPIIVTSKDAVKLPPLSNVWQLDIEAKLEPKLKSALLTWAKTC